MFLTEWAAALRSGKYKQGRNFLKCGDEYCCLGVAAELLGVKWDDRTNEGYTADGRTRVSSYNNGMQFSLLSTEHREAAGLTISQEENFAKMNDNGQTFEQIAVVLDELAAGRLS